jgi:hypothetical protein
MKKFICLLILMVFFSSSLSTVYSGGEKKIGNRSFKNNTEVVQKELEKGKKQGTELKAMPGTTDANGKKYTMLFIPGKDIDKGIFIERIVPEDEITVDLPEGSKAEPTKHEKGKK